MSDEKVTTHCAPIRDVEFGAYSRPTLEVVLSESPSYLERRYDAESGLPLIEIKE